MKIKNDFVTNSSSSSFIIQLDKLTDKQIYQIENHVNVALHTLKWKERKDRDVFNDFKYDEWKIEKFEMEKKITGWTFMTNFDMEMFFKDINVDDKIIEWNEDIRSYLPDDW